MVEIPRLWRAPSRSFFLFGPRACGKSTWLKQALPHAYRLDLLDTSLELSLTRAPHSLEALLRGQKPRSWIILDEIQKIPVLLNEVHRLMQETSWRFALCGSSARKLKRGGANLLAGRALTLHMEGLSWRELGDTFLMEKALAWGTLPLPYQAPHEAANLLHAYVNTYIKEEIKEEGIVRQAAPFLRFLQVAGLLNGQTVNASNIAREAGVPRASVDHYFEILIDTLVGHWLPAYRPAIKVREQTHPKFYWFDNGVARATAGLLFEPMDRLWQGWALETLVFHELRVYNEVWGKHRSIAYYRTAAGSEIDFVVELRKRHEGQRPRLLCIEVKRSDRWDRSWDRAMRELAQGPQVKVERMIGVYTGSRTYRFDNIEIFPVGEFFKRLYAGDFF